MASYTSYSTSSPPTIWGGLERKTREELIQIIESLRAQNDDLTLKIQKMASMSQGNNQDHDVRMPGSNFALQEKPAALLDLGSLGSNSIYFLQAADSSVGVATESTSETSSSQIRSMQSEKGPRTIRAPDVLFYKNLFKSNFVLDYDVDSPGFRYKLEVFP